MMCCICLGGCMKDKKELVYDLANTLVAILFGCIVVIFIIVNIPGTKEIDGALIANVLVCGATLFAPLAAYHLLTDWKVQHNSNIEKEYLKEIFEKMRLLYTYIDNSYELTNVYIHGNSGGEFRILNIPELDIYPITPEYTIELFDIIKDLKPIIKEFCYLTKDENISEMAEKFYKFHSYSLESLISISFYIKGKTYYKNNLKKLIKEKKLVKIIEKEIEKEIELNIFEIFGQWKVSHEILYEYLLDKLKVN